MPEVRYTIIATNHHAGGERLERLHLPHTLVLPVMTQDMALLTTVAKIEVALVQMFREGRNCRISHAISVPGIRNDVLDAIDCTHRFGQNGTDSVEQRFSQR